ncbi:HupE/UreJ family protein [Roseibium sp. Sym1]|uniref:HupE/UreJ family protein n=1 Tax=Roseibium sp. Sym1 TaxID=3016006 RepID=UPI0022B459EE|nr:HupE/UreJ family protein [Roseibium sp. Sym1]
MRKLGTTILSGMGLLLAGPALAHTGGDLSLSAGLLHPVTGIDHLLAMIGVGVLAAQRSTVDAWKLPAAFVTALAIGTFIGLSGGTVLNAEPGVLASLFVFGALIAAGTRVGLSAGLSVVALFGLLHGLAHGAEAAGATAVYLAAFLAAGAGLHGFGFALGRKVEVLTHGRLATGLVLGAGGLALAIT